MVLQNTDMYICFIQKYPSNFVAQNILFCGWYILDSWREQVLSNFALEKEHLSAAWCTTQDIYASGGFKLKILTIELYLERDLYIEIKKQSKLSYVLFGFSSPQVPE